MATRPTGIADRIVGGHHSRPHRLAVHDADNGDKKMYMAWKPEPCSTYVLPHPGGVGYLASESNHIFTWDFSTDETLLIALADWRRPIPPIDCRQLL